MKKAKRIINNTTIVKETNTELVRSCFRKIRIATRNEIADSTGLSIATCGNIMKDMLRSGEIFERELQASSGGRPAHRYEYSENYIQIACLCIFYESNIKSIKSIVANSFGEIISEQTSEFDSISQDNIESILDSLIQSYPNIKAITVSIPGKSYNGTVHVCDIDELVGVELEKSLSLKYDLKVSVEGLTELIALGYYKATPQLDNKSLAIVLAPKNMYIGSGIIINGQLVRGDQSMAGEISFISSGTKREETLTDLSKDEFLISALTTSLTAIISIINPSKIVLTGTGLTAELSDVIIHKCQSSIPEVLAPDFEFISDMEDFLINGIINITLANTTSGISIVKKII